jgi:hypothetical protein
MLSGLFTVRDSENNLVGNLPFTSVDQIISLTEGFHLARRDCVSDECKQSGLADYIYRTGAGTDRLKFQSD